MRFNKRTDTVGEPISKFKTYFFLCAFPQRFCLQRKHVGQTNFGTLGFANSIRTETAIGYDDIKIGHFLDRFSSKKGMGIETIFLAEKVVLRCLHCMETSKPL